MYLKDNPVLMKDIEDKVKVVLGVSAAPGASDGEAAADE
jgi:hypothetical protein